MRDFPNSGPRVRVPASGCPGPVPRIGSPGLRGSGCPGARVPGSRGSRSRVPCPQVQVPGSGSAGPQVPWSLGPGSTGLGRCRGPRSPGSPGLHRGGVYKNYISYRLRIGSLQAPCWLSCRSGEPLIGKSSIHEVLFGAVREVIWQNDRKRRTQRVHMDI